MSDETTIQDQTTGVQAPVVPELGNDAGGASSAEQSAAETSAPVAPDLNAAGDAPAVADESGEGAASPAATGSASDTSSSASNASPVDAIPAANVSGVQADVDAGNTPPAAPDHKSILETLFADLEGIVHMGKSEIIAVIDRAKSLL